MSGLKQLRTRLRSVISTQKVTKAMEMVAASKLRRAKEAMARAEEISLMSKDTLSIVLASQIMHDTSSNLLNLMLSEAAAKVDAVDIVVIFCSDRGLCGSYNMSLFKSLKRIMQENPKTELFVIGKKGVDYCRNLYGSNIKLHYTSAESAGKLQEIAAEIVEKFVDGKVKSCKILYNHFKNAISQVVTENSLLPLTAEHSSEIKNNYLTEYAFEGENLLRRSVELYARTTLTHLLAEAKTSEEAARTTAMNSATRNAGKMIDSLRLKLNRTRQTMITTELIEIISGAEAL